MTMEHTTFKRFAAYASIGSAILYVLSIIGLQAYIAVSLDDMSAFTQNMIDNHGMMLMYGWPGLLATLLILPLIYLFYKNNQSTPVLSRMLLWVTIIGLCFILVGYLFHLALTYFHAPMYQQMEANQQAFFGSLIKSTIGLQDMFWLSGDLFAFLGIASLLRLSLKEGSFPKWFLWLGIAAGVLAAIGSLSFIPAYKYVPGLSFLFIGGFSIFAIWEILAGVFLLRLSKL